jgi:PAS domain S-box-containing protein
VALERKKSELDKIMEFSLDMICTIDQRGHFVSVSAASYDILGYYPAELIGRRYIDFVDPQDHEKTQNFAEKVLSGAPVCKFENCYIRKDGSIIPILWSSNWDKEEKILYCIARDGTAKKQAEDLRLSLEESNRRYEYVTKATSDAIWDWDMEKGTLYWGDGYCTIFGYQLNELGNDLNTWSNHVHAEDAEAVMASLTQVIDTGETNWKQEYRFQRADDSYADVVDRGFVIRNKAGRAIRMVGALHDISERKKSLADLKKLTDDLYRRNRELQQFGYVVSHNLRSPVANIMGITSLMESEKDSDETMEFCIKNLKTSISRLDEVILDLSKILTITDSQVEISKEPVDIVEIIEKVVVDLNELILQSGAQITLPQESAMLQSHKGYLYSIFFNLVTNSIKYRSHNVPQISIMIEGSPEQIIIQIFDNGIGIDTCRYQEDLFKPYKRFNYNKEGKGLGLFLVKSHVEALNGNILLESELGKGSTFIMSFPRLGKE